MISRPNLRQNVTPPNLVNNLLGDYIALLHDAFNPATVNGLMCRNTVNASWQGEVFDCDFNQMLKRCKGVKVARPASVGCDPAQVENLEIVTGDHRFGCTAGAGSSCGGALV